MTHPHPAATSLLVTIKDRMGSSISTILRPGNELASLHREAPPRSAATRRNGLSNGRGLETPPAILPITDPFRFGAPTPGGLKTARSGYLMMTVTKFTCKS